MARVVYAPRAVSDLQRLIDFLLEAEVPEAPDAVDLIAGAVEILERHPLIGHPIERGLRELIISRGRSGYVALYEYRRHHDVVVVLAVRHQREAGYVDDAQ